MKKIKSTCISGISIIALLLLNISIFAQDVFIEKNGYAVFEAESLINAHWKIESETSGYTGKSYLRCVKDNFEKIDSSELLVYKILITTPGTYNIKIRNRHDAPRMDLWNDCWAMADGTLWYKLWSSGSQPFSKWGWDSKVHLPESFNPWHMNIMVYWDAGIHELKIGARSKGFIIDRVAVYLEEKRELALDVNTPVSAVQSTGELKSAEYRVSGVLKQWHPLTIDFNGPAANEKYHNPNPFLDYRLQVTFKGPDGQIFNVPGYFDGNGTGNGNGNVWRVRFSPNQAGNWTFKTSFRQGKNIAVSLEPKDGVKIGFDGVSGSFQIKNNMNDDPEFYKYGKLSYNGNFYFKYKDGPYWIKGGVDSPEDFLAYAGFDDTPTKHRYKKHVEDWNYGDPDWGQGKGKAIIGALNYLSAKKVNSLYFLPMNIGGDGWNVWPWVGKPEPFDTAYKGEKHGDKLYKPNNNDHTHFDISKLYQWNIVFEHAQKKGLMLNFVLNESETANKFEMDSAKLGLHRKLFYREMIARFAHYPAILWNLCEEYNLNYSIPHEDLRTFASFIQTVDPFDHPIAVHHFSAPVKSLEFLYEGSHFSSTSIQPNMMNVEKLTEQFRELAGDKGKKLPVMLDEFSIVAGQNKPFEATDNATLHRKEKIWPIYFSGGQLEFILENKSNTNNFKTNELDKLWDYTWYARKFMQENIPFWEMHPADSLVSQEATFTFGVRNWSKTWFEQLEAQVLAKPGEVYAIYFPNCTYNGYFDLSLDNNNYNYYWYNPRTGRFEGEIGTFQGNTKNFVPSPPFDVHEDWVLLVKNIWKDYDKYRK